MVVPLRAFVVSVVVAHALLLTFFFCMHCCSAVVSFSLRAIN